jgi:hypothetical protein
MASDAALDRRSKAKRQRRIVFKSRVREVASLLELDESKFTVSQVVDAATKELVFLVNFMSAISDNKGIHP